MIVDYWMITISYDLIWYVGNKKIGQLEYDIDVK